MPGRGRGRCYGGTMTPVKGRCASARLDDDGDVQLAGLHRHRGHHHAHQVESGWAIPSPRARASSTPDAAASCWARAAASCTASRRASPSARSGVFSPKRRLRTRLAPAATAASTSRPTPATSRVLTWHDVRARDSRRSGCRHRRATAAGLLRDRLDVVADRADVDAQRLHLHPARRASGGSTSAVGVGQLRRPAPRRRCRP